MSSHTGKLAPFRGLVRQLLLAARETPSRTIRARLREDGYVGSDAGFYGLLASVRIELGIASPATLRAAEAKVRRQARQKKKADRAQNVARWAAELDALAQQRASSLADSDAPSRLRAALEEAWLEIKSLRRTVADQARLLQLLAPETHPAAPSVACLYALFAEGRYHERSWRHVWNRLYPTVHHLGALPAPELTPIVWSRHLNVRRREVDRFGGTPCDHTLNIELGRCKGMLDWAVGNGMIAFNPLTAAKYVKTISRRETRLKQADVTLILSEAEKFRDRRRQDYDDDGSRAAMLKAIVLCWFDSMLRFNEARHLRRDLIAADGAYTLTANETKSGRARTVVLTPRTLEAIRAVPIHPQTNYVFVNHRTGELQGASTMRSWFRWACEHGNLDARATPRDRRIVPHHLRHAGATTADEAGARPGAIQDALGHANIRTTQTYLHRDRAESARHVAERMVMAAPAGDRAQRRSARISRAVVRGAA